MQISRLIEMIHILLDKRAVTAAELAEHFEISVLSLIHISEPTRR